MIELPGLVPRHAKSHVTEALADTRVVLVNGARQAGKTTLARLAASRRPGAVIRMLDDPATLQAAKDDPMGFVDREGLMVIDEIQLVPELLRPIKLVVDLDPTPGWCRPWCVAGRGLDRSSCRHCGREKHPRQKGRGQEGGAQGRC